MAPRLHNFTHCTCSVGRGAYRTSVRTNITAALFPVHSERMALTSACFGATTFAGIVLVERSRHRACRARTVMSRWREGNGEKGGQREERIGRGSPHEEGAEAMRQATVRLPPAPLQYVQYLIYF